MRQLEKQKSAVLSLGKPWSVSWFDNYNLPDIISHRGVQLSVLSFDYYESEILVSAESEEWIGVIHSYSKQEAPKFLNWMKFLDAGLMRILEIDQIKIQDPLGSECSSEDQNDSGYFSVIWGESSPKYAIRTLTDRILWFGKTDEKNNILSVEALGIEDIGSLIEETGKNFDVPSCFLHK